MSYSSGPWEVATSLDPTVCFSIKSDGALIAQIVKTGSPIRPAESIGNPNWFIDNDLDNVTTLANANLIAAAPDLLKALELSLEALTMAYPKYKHDRVRQSEAIILARAVIAKAKGGGM